MALLLLVVLAVVVSAVGRLGTSRVAALAVGRAVVQLTVVSLVIVVVLRSLLWSLLFVVMLGVGIVTPAQRVQALRLAVGCPVHRQVHGASGGLARANNGGPDAATRGPSVTPHRWR
ncbi:ABC transporter permease [Flexivirga sp.]|uniref:ABC transporter permease n=1 Tax=Flexivirga sp. TaxID=1962927 RepID=UPI003F80AF66